MQKAAPRSVRLLKQDNKITDIAVSLNGREALMLGPAGPERELAFLPAPLGQDEGRSFSARALPVLLGSGLGHALRAVIAHLQSAQGPDYRLAVVDKEDDILAASGLRKEFSGSNILWVSAKDADEALTAISKWPAAAGRHLLPLCNPFYLRLDRDYYGSLRGKLEQSAKADFWSRADYAKFKGEPRILLLTSSYFLVGDLEAALKRMGLAYQLLQVPEGELAAATFVEQLLEAVLRFRPDFALTINHLGVDREGILQDLLARLRLPLASWFVDNPHLILYRYAGVVSPWTTLLTWDADNIASLHALGFEHVEYLPLATDHARFCPPGQDDAAKYAGLGWQSRVSFVGNSMRYKVEKRLEAANPPAGLRAAYPALAAAFEQSDERSVYAFIKDKHPELLADFAALGSVERQLSFETLITWQATLNYRLECLRAILPFKPLIAGDDGWLKILEGEGRAWRYHPELSYYTELPHFYPFSEVNYNCTSKQMKGAVNQRVFDVPATGAFIITDWREQIERLFEPGKEVVCYHSPEEARALTERYLSSPAERQAVSRAARKRVMAEHLYEHRMTAIIAIMRKIYA